MTLLEANEGLSDSADDMETRPLGEVFKRKGSVGEPRERLPAAEEEENV
jgi:hypothetical protein